MQPTVTRAEWGARSPESRTFLVKSQQRGTAVHYSGSDSDEQADHRNCAARVRNIQRFHMDGRGWADIAYSMVVCKHGYIFAGRGIGVRTAANGTDAGNDAFHAVCFLGDDSVNRDDITDAGRRAIRQAVGACNKWAGRKEVRPHSFFKPTGCPGDQLRSWINKGMPVVSEQEDKGVSQADVIAALQSKEGQREIERAVTRILRVATGKDDASEPASAWFDDIERKVNEIHKEVMGE
jgi:hypothetical protein